MAEEQQRPLLRSAALNTTLPSGAMRVAEKQANQHQGQQQENGKQLDMQQEVERRRQRREAETAEKAARVREMRLQAAAAKAAPSTSDGGFDPSGKAAGVVVKAHSKAAPLSSSRASSGEPSTVSGRQVANRSSKPAASTQSTDGSKRQRERLSISSRPTTEPVAPAVPKAIVRVEAEAGAQLITTRTPHVADQSLQQGQLQDCQQPLVNARAEDQAQPVALGPSTASVPTLFQASDVSQATSSRQPGSRPYASAAPSQRATCQPPNGAASAAAPRMTSREGASRPLHAPPRASLGGAQRVMRTGNATPIQSGAATTAPARRITAPPAPPLGHSAPGTAGLTAKAEASGLTTAELEERHAELALGHCSTLCLKWVNATIDAALAGPAYEGQPLSACQLPLHSMPPATSAEEQVQQQEAVLAQLLTTLQHQQAENAADKAALHEELAKAGSLPEEQRLELEESLRLVAAFEEDLLRGRSVAAHWLQQTRRGHGID